MKELNRPNLHLLREEINLALAQVAAKHDVVISLGNARFSPSNANFKLEVATKGEEGQNLAAEVFKTHAKIFGLEPDDLGKTFVSGGKHFTITGLVPRRPKYPVQAACKEDGKTYKFPEGNVKRFLGR